MAADSTAFPHMTWSGTVTGTMWLVGRKGNLMKQVIDRFGEDVLTRDLGDGAFEAEVFLSASPTFYAWVFTFGGDIQIAAPETIREQYQQMLQKCLETGK